MALFGLGDVGNNARRQINTIPVWLQARMNQAFQDSNGMMDASNPLLQRYVAYLNGIVDQPNESVVATPGDVRSYGQQISPRTDQALSQIDSGNQLVTDALGRVRSRKDTTGAITENLDTLQSANDQLAGFNTGQVKNTFDNLSVLKDRIFNDRQAFTGDAFGQMTADQKAAYGDATKTLEGLLPRGDLAAAASARAWAPAMAAAQRRLRAAGIDPNSPEAQDALQQVDVGRARSADDLLSQNLGSYIGDKNNLRLGLNDALTGLNKDKLGLARDDQSWLWDTTANLDTNRAQALMGVEREKYGNFSDITGQKNANIQNDRNLSIQDVELNQNVAEFINNALKSGVDMQSTQFQQAFGNLLAGMQQKNQANAQVGAQGNTWQDRALQYGNQGMAFADRALPAFASSLQLESANNGWLGKLLIGLGTAGLNAVAPGAGTAIGGAASSAAGYNQPQLQYSSPYGGTPGFNPNASNPYGKDAGNPYGTDAMSSFYNGLTNKLGLNKKPVTSQIPISSSSRGGQQPWQVPWNTAPAY